MAIGTWRFGTHRKGALYNTPKWSFINHHLNIHTYAPKRKYHGVLRSSQKAGNFYFSDAYIPLKLPESTIMENFLFTEYLHVHV